MADGGIGEAALLDAALEGAGTGALVGGGVSALTGRDPFQGALMGGLTGGLFGGAGSAFSDVPVGTDAFTAQTSTGLPTVAADASSSSQALTGLQTPPTYDLSTNYLDYGNPSPYGGGSTNGIVGSQGGANTLNNFSEYVPPSGVEPVSASANAFGAPSTNMIISPDAVATGAGATPAATGGSGISNLLDKAGSYLPETTAGRAMLGGGLGLAYLMNQERNKYGVPAAEKYTGPLSKFSYNPSTYQPDIVRPPNPVYRAQYAAGGPVEMMSNNAAIGANTMYPMANISTSSYGTPDQMASGGSVPRFGIGGFLDDAVHGVGNVVNNAMQGRVSMANPDYGNYSSLNEMMDDYRRAQSGNAPAPYSPPNVNANVYKPQYASGGITSLGSYSDGGRMLKGPGDGMSDSIPANISGKREARLADGEFVVPADVVSHLGNGSTDAGAKQLYSMMDKVRTARTGRKSQGRQIKPNKYMPA